MGKKQILAALACTMLVTACQGKKKKKETVITKSQDSGICLTEGEALGLLKGIDVIGEKVDGSTLEVSRISTSMVDVGSGIRKLQVLVDPQGDPKRTDYAEIRVCNEAGKCLKTEESPAFGEDFRISESFAAAGGLIHGEARACVSEKRNIGESPCGPWKRSENELVQSYQGEASQEAIKLFDTLQEIHRAKYRLGKSLEGPAGEYLKREPGLELTSDVGDGKRFDLFARFIVARPQAMGEIFRDTQKFNNLYMSMKAETQAQGLGLNADTPCVPKTVTVTKDNPEQAAKIEELQKAKEDLEKHEAELEAKIVEATKKEAELTEGLKKSNDAGTASDKKVTDLQNDIKTLTEQKTAVEEKVTVIETGIKEAQSFMSVKGEKEFALLMDYKGADTPAEKREFATNLYTMDTEIQKEVSEKKQAALLNVKVKPTKQCAEKVNADGRVEFHQCEFDTELDSKDSQLVTIVDAKDGSATRKIMFGEDTGLCLGWDDENKGGGVIFKVCNDADISQRMVFAYDNNIVNDVNVQIKFQREVKDGDKTVKRTLCLQKAEAVLSAAECSAAKPREQLFYIGAPLSADERFELERGPEWATGKTDGKSSSDKAILGGFVTMLLGAVAVVTGTGVLIGGALTKPAALPRNADPAAVARRDAVADHVNRRANHLKVAGVVAGIAGVCVLVLGGSLYGAKKAEQDAATAAAGTQPSGASASTAAASVAAPAGSGLVGETKSADESLLDSFDASIKSYRKLVIKEDELQKKLEAKLGATKP